jgi:hypothetical protein
LLYSCELKKVVCLSMGLQHAAWLFTVPVRVEGLEVTVVGETFNCLFQGRDVILTCSISGFPRPRILFDRNGDRIIPRMPGFERITNISFDQVSIGLRHELFSGFRFFTGKPLRVKR